MATEELHILLAEDNPHDVLFTQKALEFAKINNTLHVVTDGREALKFLNGETPYEDKPLPSLILLDINMPFKSGFDVLDEVKANLATRHIPVVILTSSDAEKDIYQAYEKYVNAFITKPLDPKKWFDLFKKIDDFWFKIVKLANKPR